MEKEKKHNLGVLLFRILSLLVAIIAITLQLFTNKNIGKGFMANHVLAYFTIQTNILSAFLFLYLIIKTIIISAKNHSLEMAHTSPSLHTAITLYISITMLVYWLVLAPMLGVAKSPLEFFNTLFLHTLTPICTIIDFIFFCHHGKLSKLDPVKWLSYPILYLVSVIIIANVSTIPYYKFKFNGQVIPLMYPYPFIDPQIVGVGGMIGICFLLIAFFLAFSYLYVFIDNQIKKHQDKKLQKNLI